MVKLVVGGYAMRKSVIFTMAVLALFALAACGDGDEPAAPAPQPPPEPTSAPSTPAVAQASQPTAAPTPAAQPAAPPAQTPTQAPAAQPTQTPASEPTATARPETAGPAESEAEEAPTPVGLFLEVTEPEDETLLSNATIDVAGMTTPDAVVTINGEPIEVDAEGNFVMSVKLDEGPNVLEIVGSDFSGERIEEILTVIYVP